MDYDICALISWEYPAYRRKLVRITMLAESDYFNSMATDRSVDVQSTVAVGYPQVTEVAQVNPSRIIKAH